MRFGIAGYGPGRRLFHTPFIQAAAGLDIAGVVTRSSPAARPGRPGPAGHACFDSLTAMIAAGIDVVTITTSPHTHRENAL
jgi:predicted dehydrogenase